MPTYDYLCTYCGAREERFRSMSRIHDHTVCSECSSDMEHIMSIPQTFIFRAPRDVRPYVDRVKESYERDPPKTNKK